MMPLSARDRKRLGDFSDLVVTEGPDSAEVKTWLEHVAEEGSSRLVELARALVLLKRKIDGDERNVDEENRLMRRLSSKDRVRLVDFSDLIAVEGSDSKEAKAWLEHAEQEGPSHLVKLAKIAASIERQRSEKTP